MMVMAVTGNFRDIRSGLTDGGGTGSFRHLGCFGYWGLTIQGIMFGAKDRKRGYTMGFAVSLVFI